MDMLGMSLRAMGIDVEGVVGQITKIHELFVALDQRLGRIESGLNTLMLAQGLYVPPTEETTKLIETESLAYVESQVHLDKNGLSK